MFYKYCLGLWLFLDEKLFAIDYPCISRLSFLMIELNGWCVCKFCVANPANEANLFYDYCEISNFSGISKYNVKLQTSD